MHSCTPLEVKEVIPHMQNILGHSEVELHMPTILPSSVKRLSHTCKWFSKQKFFKHRFWPEFFFILFQFGSLGKNSSLHKNCLNLGFKTVMTLRLTISKVRIFDSWTCRFFSYFNFQPQYYCRFICSLLA